jgi:hypothetical protein
MATELGGELGALPGMNANAIKSNNITVLALTPGWLRSEEMLDIFGVTKDTWHDGIGSKHDPDGSFAFSETPHYIGRAVVALATDPTIHKKHGQAFATWTLVREYNFTDIDGSQPHWADKTR